MVGEPAWTCLHDRERQQLEEELNLQVLLQLLFEPTFANVSLAKKASYTVRPRVREWGSRLPVDERAATPQTVATDTEIGGVSGVFCPAVYHHIAVKS